MLLYLVHQIFLCLCTELVSCHYIFYRKISVEYADATQHHVLSPFLWKEFSTGHELFHSSQHSMTLITYLLLVLFSIRGHLQVTHIVIIQEHSIRVNVIFPSLVNLLYTTHGIRYQTTRSRNRLRCSCKPLAWHFLCFCTFYHRW